MMGELVAQARVIARTDNLDAVRWRGVLRDWRAYVPDAIRVLWRSLTDDQRALVILVADEAHTRALDEAMSQSRYDAEQ